MVLTGTPWGAGGGEGSATGAGVGSSSEAGADSAVGTTAGVETLFSGCGATAWLASSGCVDQGRQLGFTAGFGATGGGFLFFRED